MNHDEGILVRSAAYGETSLLTTWITREHGILRLMIKGVRTAAPVGKSGKPRRSGTGGSGADLLSRAEISFQRSTRSQLHSLRELKILRSHRAVATDYTKQLACFYAFEVIAQLVEPDTAIPEPFECFSRLVDYLESHAVSVELIERFERRLLGLLGLPHLGEEMDRVRRRHYARVPRCWPGLREALRHAPGR